MKDQTLGDAAACGDLFDQAASFGTEPHKLHRRDNVETSVTAAHALDSCRLEKMVFEKIKSFGFRGAISDEVRALCPGFSYSSITGRFAALEEKGFIVRGPDKRPGASGRNQLVMREVRR